MSSLPNNDDENAGAPGRVRVTRSISRALGTVANMLLCIMVVITCIDVVGRYFFAAPLLGAHELMTLAMGIMIFLGMPLVTAAEEHLTVDIVAKSSVRRASAPGGSSSTPSPLCPSYCSPASFGATVSDLRKTSSPLRIWSLNKLPLLS